MDKIICKATVYDVKLMKRDGGGFRLLLDIAETDLVTAVKLMPLATQDVIVKVTIEKDL